MKDVVNPKDKDYRLLVERLLAENPVGLLKGWECVSAILSGKRYLISYYLIHMSKRVKKKAALKKKATKKKPAKKEK